jgi:hypothetical protein
MRALNLKESLITWLSMRFLRHASKARLKGVSDLIRGDYYSFFLLLSGRNVSTRYYFETCIQQIEYRLRYLKVLVLGGGTFPLPNRPDLVRY